MKKQNFLTMAVLVAIFGLAACNSGYDAKKVTLKNQNDSLNYALGLSNGDGIRGAYFQNDSSEKDMAAMVAAVEKAFKDNNTDELYKIGRQVGTSLKQQKKDGLMGDSTLKVNVNLVKQGLLNALKGHKEGMTSEEAMHYLQTTMQKIQEAKAPHPAPAPVPAAPVDTTKK